VLLFILSVLRVGVDELWAPRPPVQDGISKLPEILEESEATRDETRRRSLPLGPGETVDPNRSGEEDLDRLPGVGPATARAWVEHRSELNGIGGATLEKIRDHLDFSSGVPMELRSPREPGGTSSGSDRGTVRTVLSREAPSRSRAVSPVDLNRAGPEELQTLPGIGPALAERILESRKREGPFRSAEDLLRVRGIGPATLARFRTRVLPSGGSGR
jgi:competence protein ComEA